MTESASSPKSAPGPTVVKIPFKPTTPKFGGLEEVGTDSWAAWTGGKPKADWSGLEVTKPKSLTPHQYRSTSIINQAKGLEYRIKGLETKFTGDSDLQLFQMQVLEHLEQHGMDTITYLQDPTDPSQVISVIDNHSRFDIKTGCKLSKQVAKHYDSYDDENVRDAKKFLRKSIDANLEKQLYENCETDDNFITIWLNLIHMVRSVSINRFSKIKERIKGRKISSYAGENIQSIVSDYLSDWKELHDARMYDPNLTMAMLDQMMEAGGKANEDFRHPLRTIRMALNKKLLEVRHMNYEDANKSMVNDELDVRSITMQAKELYRTLYEDNKWPAAAHAKDAKGINQNYGTVNMADTNQLKQMVYALVQSAGGSSRDKSSDTCNNCGKKGHWARDCRDKRNGDGKTFSSKYKSLRNNPGRGGPGRGGPGRTGNTPRTPPPKPGESEIKFINGKKSYWCAKCNRWTISHGTDGHKTKEELQGGRPAASMARVNFDLHPSAFMAMGPASIDCNGNGYWSWTFILEKLIKIIMSVTWLWYMMYHTEPTTYCSDLWSGMVNLIGPLRELMEINWLFVIMSFASGFIGFGSACKLYYSAIEPKVRYRRGENVMKQAKRRNKVTPKSKRHFSLSPITVPLINERENFSHHHRFNHVLRPMRHEMPSVERIRIVQARIRTLRKEISFHESKLRALRKELKKSEQLLKRLMKEDMKRFKVKTNKQMCRTLPKGVHPWYNKPQSPPKLLKRNFVFGMISDFRCAMSNLVNLSDIAGNEVDPTKVETVLFDSGANCCVTNRMSDFVGEFHNESKGQIVDGIGKGLKIEGDGRVAWTFKADNGMYRTIVVPCYYIPSATARIASLQELLKQYPKETISMNANSMTLSGFESTPPITVQFSPTSNLPMGITEKITPTVNKGERKPKSELPNMKQPSLTAASNFNLTEPEKELLRWHHRLGHIGMKRVQWLFRQGILSTSEQSRRLQAGASKLTHGPMCTACQYAKQRRRTMPGTVKHTIKSEVGKLKRNDLFPGQEISVDHFACNPLGRLLHTYGKEKPDAKYKGGCIFVDHASGYMHTTLQVSLNSHATLDAKKEFEEMCANYGVIAQSYLSDNGTAFVNQHYEAHLNQFHQTIRHSSVGAHHSNGIAERGISTVMSIARAMLHHAAIHWPDVADVELWPLAVLHAIHILNRIPREDNGRSPIELFSRKTWSNSKFHDFHVWGCPVYVLNSKIADGHKLPRWQPRSSRSVYVGNSMKHGHAVPLVLCLETGAITPQYNVVFDDWFQTVEATDSTTVNFEHDDWYRTFGLTPQQYVADESDTTGDIPVPTVQESEGANQQEHLRSVRDRNLPPRPINILEESKPDGSSHQREQTLIREVDPEPRFLPSRPHVETVPDSPVRTPPVSILQEATQAPSMPQDSLQREKEQPASPPKVTQQSEPELTPPRPPRPIRPPVVPRRPLTRSQTRHPNVNMAQEHAYLYEALYVGKAANTDPDNYTWEEAMASPYKEQFLEAADAEIQALVSKGTWVECSKSQATNKVIPSQWVFRIKRTPDGVVKKFKGRIVLRGDLQEDDGKSNFSPVAAWSTVRSFLAVCTLREWTTTTIDFSNAFVQSDLPDDEPVWMHLPRGYRSTAGSDQCLRLVKSLYGHVRAPQLWFNYSSDAFRKLGLFQSEHDQCLWYGDNIMLVQYVDDCGIGAPNQARIDKFVADLRDLGLELTQEESFSEFLGIKFETKPDGAIECTQRGLIKKTLEAAEMESCNPNSVPAAQHGLGTDAEGEPMDETWNYRGICGMLLYLSTNTRPDIAFAVSQVCRFGTNPKKSHATAVKTILRYLKKTQDKGIIVKPGDHEFNLDLYVDADFCGLFGREDPRNPESVKSRTGYIITLCGWPIVWKSHLQSHLSQSTLEAEYSALSSSLRVFIPLRRLIEDMIEKTNYKQLKDSRLHATVFEDNQSTYFLATNQRITSRTKYLLAKWHWFWDAYNRNEFTIVKCPTDKQNADYLTKSQPRAVFESNREAVQGW